MRDGHNRGQQADEGARRFGMRATEQRVGGNALHLSATVDHLRCNKVASLAVSTIVTPA